MNNFTPPTTRQKLASRLQLLRKERNFTQKQLAEQLNTSVSSIISYENAQRFPSSAVIGLLCQFFDVNAEYLLGETNERCPAQKWDGPELVQAVTDNISSLFHSVEQAVRGMSAEEQKLIFDVLVELRHVLNIKDYEKRKTTLSMLHDVTAAFEHLADSREP